MRLLRTVALLVGVALCAQIGSVLAAGPTPPPAIAPRHGLTFNWGPGSLSGSAVIAWVGIPAYVTCYFNAANFAGGNASAAASGTATFAVSYIRSGSPTSIGNVVFAASSATPTFPNVTVNLQPGDIVEATSPSPVDGNLSDPMFFVPCIQTQ